MGLKYLIITFLIYVVFRLIKRLFGFSQTRSGSVGSSRDAEKIAGSGQLMVRCTKCGTFIPEGRVVTAGEKAYCSRECAVE